ncbi:putative glycosyl hydrolase family 71 protein [Phaeomoniella chlamydospora]|uniref:Putative glycosyl hydrolase family 71 protein n=1 Tax=Phaeomoniella chlamydospora TaxID=158046 RepID=A0A0G2EPE8_PHACM|nr:putative glycosyl hydrolase family 71 protein [Phaeomoniella chlamydospora]
MRCSTLLSVAAAIISAPHALATDKYVYAHFIAGNAAGMTSDEWATDIAAAQKAGIDGFAMNIAPNDGNTDSVLETAYAAAETAGFSLFLSFDYLSNGVWSADSVISKINQYKDSSAYFNYEGSPLVSTFEGVDNTGDWESIKSSTGCFFIPDWASLGVSDFTSQSSIDGAFVWDAWPDGPSSMTTDNDESYMSALGGKPYMMAVSPWFYTNMPEYSKNWLWRGDTLWSDRWEQIIELQPAMVEILTWNDYGESHYIGPIHDSGIPSSVEYASGMPHDGWRSYLPYYIEAYKSNNATSTSTSTSNTTTNSYSASTSSSSSSSSSTDDKITYWYRLTPGSAGSTGGTTGNNAADGQTVYSPLVVSQDKIFASVYVTEASDVTIQVGENSASSFRATTSGVSTFSTSMNGQTGNVTFTVSRNGATVVSVTGPEITDTTTTGNLNFNAYVGSSEDL